MCNDKRLQNCVLKNRPTLTTCREYVNISKSNSEEKMERIAIIADIHSNLQALKAVLKNIKEQGIEKIICLGDIIGKGQNAHECVQLVKKYCQIVVAGNTDKRFSGDAEPFKEDKVEYGRIKWNRSLLTQDDVDFLQAIPFSYEFEVGGKLVRFFHATPKSMFDFVNSFEKDLGKNYAMFLPSENTMSQKIADVVIYGHLHYPFLTTIYNKTLICCGSVGLSTSYIQNDQRNSSPEEITKAHYVVMSIDNDQSLSYQFVNVKYDKQKEIASNTQNPELETFKTEIEHGIYRNMQRTIKTLEDKGFENI